MLMDHVTDDLVRRDHSGPERRGTGARTTFGEIALTTPEESLAKAGTLRRIVGDGAVVGHRDGG